MVTVYRAPVGSFIDNFILLTNELPIKPRILIVSDFNLDQMLPDNVAKIAALSQNFNLAVFTIFNSYTLGILEYCMFYLILQIPILFFLSSSCRDYFVLSFQI